VCDSILFIGSSFKEVCHKYDEETNESASEVNKKKNKTVRLRIYKEKKRRRRGRQNWC